MQILRNCFRKVAKYMISTIIFDIGNVLTGFEWKGFFESFGYEQEILDKLAAATTLNEDWNEYDRGILTDEEVLEEFVKNDPSIEAEIRNCIADIGNILLRYDYAIPWISELKSKGYRVLVLSNFSHKAYVDCSHALDFLPYTDGGILSFREKCIKPEPEIYRRLIETYNLVPEECVFLDDLQRNLNAAAAFGIHTILFQNQAQAKEELKKLGVN